MTEQVLIVSGLAPGCGGMDSGCQGWLLAHAMRKHLGWTAQNLSFGTSYLAYPTDWVFEKNVSRATVMEYAKECTYFIFLDSIVDIPGLPLGQFLRPNNHCIIGVGSGLRNTADYVLMDQIKRGLTVVVAPQDETTVTRVIGVPFDFIIVDIEEIEAITKGVEKNDEFTVCHAHTHGGVTKGGEIIEKVMADMPDIRFEEISGMPWRDAIRAKAKCHAIIDDLVLPTYGLNVLEAGILHQHVLSDIGPWCYMTYVDFPFSSVNTLMTHEDVVDTIEDQINALCEFPEMWEHKLDDADAWVRAHHSPEVVSERWKHFINWSKNRC